MSEGPLDRYRSLVDAGTIAYDSAQLLVAEKLQVLANRLANYGRPARRLIIPIFERRSMSDAPLGLYIYGGVGRGKTMLMDLFFDTVAFSPKRRVHFHAFMADVHERLAIARATHEGDPIRPVALSIAAEARLLCFDELFVRDIADATILGRLFKELFKEQVVVVATSNAHPRELYKDGLNREHFLPFIDLVEQRMSVIELEAAHDYRHTKLAGQPLYFTPDDDAAREALAKAFFRMTGREHGQPTEIRVKGRSVKVPEAALGTARFSFDDLCRQPLGPNDYLAIAETFHTLVLAGIPRLEPALRNEARRFVTLVDTLYDRRVGLIASAEAEPHELYPAGDGADLFERTASRLVEMRSDAYLDSRGEPRQAG